VATTIPTLQAYDPAYAYELAVIVQDGLHRMYGEGEDIFYYLSVYNEAYEQPAMPEGVEEGIVKGMYKLNSKNVKGSKGRVQLFGSGTILREALRAQELLADQFKVASDVWSVTSYSQMARDAATVERWNRFHPTDEAKASYLQECLADVEGPIVSTSDNVRLVGDQIRPWLSQQYIVLGTDGFGRSETRPALRRHFEIDAENVAYAALCGLANEDKFDKAKLPEALKSLDVDPEKLNPLYA
jgi:pyruvate dehydrogenase E1 component